MAQTELANAGHPASWDFVKKAVDQQKNIISFAQKKPHNTDSGINPKELRPVSIAELVSDLKLTFQNQAERKGLTLNFPEASEIEKVFVMAEPITLLNTVLSNFILNAIKFSHSGGQIDLRVQANGWGRVSLQVSDHGVGINRAKLTLIEAGGQSAFSSPGTQNEKGMGIGLSLAKIFIAGYGGKLRIESKSAEDGHQATGTTVTLELDRAENADVVSLRA